MITRSFGRDNGLEMSIAELRDALPVKFDFLIFDACFMGSVEVEYELRDKADYIMASSAEILSYGFPYKEILPHLFAERYDLPKVGDEFIDFYKAQKGNLATATISIVETAKLTKLCYLARRIFSSANSVDQLDLSGFQQFEANPQDRIFDMGQVFLGINTDPNLAVEYSELADEVVVYKKNTENIWERPVDAFSGLSIFVPTSPDDQLIDYYETLSWYKDSGCGSWIAR
jgi:hypothetical protein